MERWTELILFLSLTICQVNSINESSKFQLIRESCPTGMVKCEKGENLKTSTKCIEESDVCNNKSDCTDNSDEKYCNYNFNYGVTGFAYKFVQGSCPEDFVMCPSGKHPHSSGIKDARCIPVAWICDKTVDCRDLRESQFCPYDHNKIFNFRFDRSNCPEGHYTCRSGLPKQPSSNITNNNCIMESWICDGHEHCEDGSDENYCPYLLSTKLENSVVQPETTTVEETLTNRIVSMSSTDTIPTTSDQSKPIKTQPTETEPAITDLIEPNELALSEIAYYYKPTEIQLSDTSSIVPDHIEPTTMQFTEHNTENSGMVNKTAQLEFNSTLNTSELITKLKGMESKFYNNRILLYCSISVSVLSISTLIFYVIFNINRRSHTIYGQLPSHHQTSTSSSLISFTIP